jgi:hypothetical protein
MVVISNLLDYVEELKSEIHFLKMDLLLMRDDEKAKILKEKVDCLSSIADDLKEFC